MVLNVRNNMAIPEAAATLRAYITRPSRELKENWEVDLAALLQEYFQYLFKELEKSDNVKNAANFAEAALIIQASSEIYCKKVDYLWDQMLKLLQRLQSEKTDDPKDNQKCGRRRVDELEKSRLFEEVLRKVVVPDIKNGMAEKVKLLVDHFHLLVKLREKQLYGEVEEEEVVEEEGDSLDIDEMGENTRKEAFKKLTDKELLKKPLFPPSFWIDAFQIIEAGLRKLLHLGPEDPIDHAAVDAECERHKEQREAEATPGTQCNEENAPDAQRSGESAPNTQNEEENAPNTQNKQENAPDPQHIGDSPPECNPPKTQPSKENAKATVDEDVGYMTGNDDIASLTSNEVVVPAGMCDEAGTSTTVDADLGVLTPSEPPPPPPEPPPLPPEQTSTLPEQTALAVTTPLPSTLLEKDDQEVLAGSRSARRRDKIVTVLSPWVEFPNERLYQEKVFRKRKTTELTAEEIAAIESLKDRIVVRPRIAPEYLRKEAFLAQHGITIEANGNPVPAENRVSVIYLIDVKHKKRLIQELEKRIIFEDNLEALRKKYSQDIEEDFRGFEDLEPSDTETDGFRGFPSPPPVSNSCATVVEDEEEDFHGFPDENVPETQQKESNDPSHVGPETQQKESNDPSPPELESSVKPPERREKDDNAPVIETEAANSCNIEISQSDADPLAMDCMAMTLLSSTSQHEAMGEFHAPSEESQGIRDPFAAIRQPFAENQAHSSHQYVMQEDSEKPSRKRKCNQSKCKDVPTSSEDEAQDSEEDEWWLEPKKVARKRKLNKR